MKFLKYFNEVSQHHIPVTQRVTCTADHQEQKSNFCFHLCSLLWVKLSLNLQLPCLGLCLFSVKLPHSNLVLITPYHLSSCAISLNSQTLRLLGRHYTNLLYPILPCQRQQCQHCPSPSVTLTPMTTQTVLLHQKTELRFVFQENKSMEEQK